MRTPAEFDAGHVDGAVNVPVLLTVDGEMVPNEDFLPQVLAAFPDKTAPMLVGCKSGRRSTRAGTVLDGEGYEDLTNVQGGFDEWSAL